MSDNPASPLVPSEAGGRAPVPTCGADIPTGPCVMLASDCAELPMHNGLTDLLGAHDRGEASHAQMAALANYVHTGRRLHGGRGAGVGVGQHYEQGYPDIAARQGTGASPRPSRLPLLRGRGTAAGSGVSAWRKQSRGVHPLSPHPRRSRCRGVRAVTAPPKLADPADAKGTDQFVTVHRNGGWTVKQWIAYLDRWPHATLPSGVGRMIVDHYEWMRDER